MASSTNPQRLLLTALLMIPVLVTTAQMLNKAMPGQDNRPGTETKLTVVDLEEAYPKMVAAFRKQFPKASAVDWSRLARGFHVSFVEGSNKWRAVFTGNGMMNYSVKELTVNDLPGELTELLKNDYKEYKLFHAQEISDAGAGCIYLVLENGEGFRTMRYCEGLLEERGRRLKSENRSLTHQ